MSEFCLVQEETVNFLKKFQIFKKTLELVKLNFARDLFRSCQKNPVFLNFCAAGISKILKIEYFKELFLNVCRKNFKSFLNKVLKSLKQIKLRGMLINKLQHN
jgi:hypothetical protein